MMNEILSAASLFLAVIGLLYSSWYSEISKVISLKKERPRIDIKPLISEAKTVYITRAIPLAIASITLALILLPSLFLEVSLAINILISKRVKSPLFFDPVKALFVAIAIAAVWFGIHTCRLAWKSRKAWKNLDSD